MEALLRAGAGATGNVKDLLSAPEAERMIERLAVMPLEQYGSPTFLEQHDWVTQLNLQAHHNAAAQSDEFVMEALVSRGKVDTLIHSLLVTEAWREHAYPLLRAHLAAHVDSAISWSLLYHETALANLLEVALYHRAACEAASEDMLLELAQWAYRKLSYLNSEGHVHTAAAARERSASELMAQAPEEELGERAAEVAWGAAMCGLTIARYLTEHVASLPLGVMTQLLSSNDTIMALVPLVDRPPWTRRNKGQLEKFKDGRWQVVPPADHEKLTQTDAQVWLALHNLLLDPACRAKWDPDEHRVSALQRLRRHLHEALLDQLPVLKGLQRLLDEMALGGGDVASGRVFGSDQGPGGGGGGGGSGAGRAARLILEQVPAVREGLLRGRDWPALAAQLQETWLGAGAARLARERAERMLKSFDFLCSLEEAAAPQHGPGAAAAGGGSASALPTAGGGASACGASAGLDDNSVRVECWRRVRAGVHERWCEFDCRLDCARPSEPVLVKGEGGREVRGERHRLLPLAAEATRPLPCDGKIVVRCRGRKAEALLQLPAIAVRSLDSDAPEGLWLTAGLLASDGLALQLRLRRAAKALERDRHAGVWYAYHPVGGALTLAVVADAGTAGPEGRSRAAGGSGGSASKLQAVL